MPWVDRCLRRLGAPAGLGIPSSPIQVRIADTVPRKTVDITVPMKAHSLPGTAEIHWKMVDDEGYEFFPDRYHQGLFITIVVREGAPEPTVRQIVDDANGLSRRVTAPSNAQAVSSGSNSSRALCKCSNTASAMPSMRSVSTLPTSNQGTSPTRLPG